MAKKKSSKKKSKPKLTFEEVSTKFRGEKIVEKKNNKGMKESKKILKKYAAEGNLHGNYHGIRVTPNYKFLEEENIELAKEMGIALSVQTIVEIDYEKLVQLAEEKGITIPKIEKQLVDLKVLEKVFIKHEIVGNYLFKHYSFGLSTED